MYLPFSDWFGTKRTSVWFQINRKMLNTIWFRVDLIRFLLCVGGRILLGSLSEVLSWTGIFYNGCWEARASLRISSPIQDPAYTPPYNIVVMLEGFQGYLNCTPYRCRFFTCRIFLQWSWIAWIMNFQAIQAFFFVMSLNSSTCAVRETASLGQQMLGYSGFFFVMSLNSPALDRVMQRRYWS